MEPNLPQTNKDRRRRRKKNKEKGKFICKKNIYSLPLTKHITHMLFKIKNFNNKKYLQVKMNLSSRQPKS